MDDSARVNGSREALNKWDIKEDQRIQTEVRLSQFFLPASFFVERFSETINTYRLARLSSSAAKVRHGTAGQARLLVEVPPGRTSRAAKARIA